MEIALRSDEESITRGADAVDALCGRAGFGADRKVEVRTAVVEALVNAMIHGNGRDPAAPILLRAAIENGAVLVEVHDSGSGPGGVPPEPDAEKQLDGRQPTGGWGVHLMRALASEVDFHAVPGDGHRVRLRFDARAPRRPAVPSIRRPSDG